jgi:UDP-3-O-acyl-N-acetylglucosamine deacetylase
MTVGTIEHLLATLHAYGITDLLIKAQSEVPTMDGSAKEFCAPDRAGGGGGSERAASRRSSSRAHPHWRARSR